MRSFNIGLFMLLPRDSNMRLSIKGTQKTRLTGMQIPPLIAVRFGVLHTGHYGCRMA